MQLVRPSSDWLPARPFWRSLSDFGKRVVAVDLPMTYAPEPFKGVEVQGWVTHDRLTSPRCHPTDLARWIRSQVGSPPLGGEPYGPLPVKTLLKFRDELLASTQYVSDLAVAMVKREQADLFLFAFTSTHTGGHKFWDLSGVRGQVSEEEREQLSRSLRDVYLACDRAVGEILQAACTPATVIVFSLHGMGPNNSRAEILSSMLGRVPGLNTERRDSGPLGVFAQWFPRIGAILSSDICPPRSRID
jgi:predicted AlkP superfamily phosphohydrolase/phosphomutase